jgi:hypothetical protein
MNWQPIESAPEFPFDQEKWFLNGPRYLLWAGNVTIGSYSYTEKGKGRWRNWIGVIQPTHWMPLPPPPNIGAKEQ